MKALEQVAIVRITNVEAVKDILGLTSAATIKHAPDAVRSHRSSSQFETGVESFNKGPNLGPSRYPKFQVSAAVRMHRARLLQRYVDKLLICMVVLCKSARVPANDDRARIVKENHIWISILNPRGRLVIQGPVTAPRLIRSLRSCAVLGCKIPIMFAVVYMKRRYLPNSKQARDRFMQESEESTQPYYKDHIIFETLCNVIGVRKGQSEVEDKEDNLGVGMFFWRVWRRNRVSSRISERQHLEHKKQEGLGKGLGEGPGEPLSALVEDPQVTACD